METKFKTPYYAAQYKIGTAYEKRIYQALEGQGMYLQTHYGYQNQINVGENPFGLEIKLDARSADTGRLSIEVAEKTHPDNPKWIPSGIYRSDNTKIYAQGNWNKCYFFDKNILVNYKEQYTPPIYESKGTIKKFYMPIEDAEKLCIFCLDLSKANGSNVDVSDDCRYGSGYSGNGE